MVVAGASAPASPDDEIMDYKAPQANDRTVIALLPLARRADSPMGALRHTAGLEFTPRNAVVPLRWAPQNLDSDKASDMPAGTAAF